MAKRKTSKKVNGKDKEVKEAKKSETLATACAKLETVKALHSLPLFGEIFGGEVEQSETAQTKLANATTVNPDLMKVIGQTKNAYPLRIKKKALVLFCKVATIASPDFAANLKTASGHDTTSTINKHDLQIALFSLMSATEFVATYKAYQATLASE